MKFRIESTVWQDNPEQVLEKYPVLEHFNHTVETKPVTYQPGAVFDYEWTTDECSGYVNVDSIERLITLIDAVGNPVIIYEHPAISCAGEYCIEIYDGFRE